MNSPFRIPIAVVAVIALTIGLEVPQLFASSRLQTNATTDRETLVALYQATDGDNWKNNRNWLDDRAAPFVARCHCRPQTVALLNWTSRRTS